MSAAATASPPTPASVRPRPGRKRSRAVDDALLAAALEVLRVEGYAALTMAAVFERAGVSSASLYRRWPSKKDLVVAALESLTPTPAGIDTGSFAGDLAAFLDDVARSLRARLQRVPASLTFEMRRYPDLSDALREAFLAPRLAEIGEIL